MTRAENTQYGFRFGTLLVERATSLLDGRVCVSIKSDTGRELHVYASRTGRSVRVFTPGGEEWQPKGKAAADGL
jgi:hypothetical protein